MKIHFGSFFGSTYSGVTLDEEDIERLKNLPPSDHAPAVLHAFFAIKTTLIMAFVIWASTSLPPDYSQSSFVGFSLGICLSVWWFFAWVAKNLRF